MNRYHKYDLSDFRPRRKGPIVQKVVGLTLATSMVFAAPMAPNVINVEKVGVSSSVVHAQSQNLLENDSGNFYVGHHWDHSITRHTLNYSGFATAGLDNLNEITYIVQLPNELAYLLDDEEVIANTFSEFDIYGYVQNNHGEEESLTVVDNVVDYLSVNRSTNSVEFNFKQLLLDYDFTIVEGNSYGIYFRLITPYLGLANGNYEIRAALTEGSTDLTNVSNAFTGTLTVDYNEDDEEPDANKDELEALVKSIYDADYEEEFYTEESWAAFSEALAIAEQVLEDDNATQDEVNQTTENLREAINNLAFTTPEDPEDPEEPSEPGDPGEPDEPGEPSEPDDPEVNKDELVAFLQEIYEQKLKAENYTEESWEIFSAALQTSEQLVNDEEATQAEVDQSLEILVQAFDQLELIITTPDPVDPVHPVPTDPEPTEPEPTEPSEPGDSTDTTDPEAESGDNNDGGKVIVTVENDDSDSSADADKDKNGVLPKTATNAWNLGLAGVAVLLAGIATNLKARFRKTSLK